MKWIYLVLVKILKWVYLALTRILKRIDLVLVGLLLLAVIFGIVSPFIWMWKWGKPPPEGLISLSVLLTIILALLGLFVGLAYRDLRHRLEESLGEEIRKEAMAALARAVGMTAYTAWAAWRCDRKSGELLDQALIMQKYAYEDLIARLTKQQLRKVADILPEDKIYQQKSNLAAYIAYKKHYFPPVSPDDERLARKLGKEAYEKALELGDSYDWHANYAGVLKVFGTNAEKRKAEQIMTEIKSRVTPQEWKEYRKLFGPPSNPTIYP